MITNLPTFKGLGYAVPSVKITNDNLTKLYDTSDEWIYSRTGIKERHIFANDAEAYDLLKKACSQAITNAELKANEIDLIIAATSMPVQIMPSTACVVQKLLNITSTAPAFDISAACSGFIYALDVANSYIKSGVYKNILLVTMDNCSRYLDWTDRRTSILFGDGVGAAVISSGEKADILAIDIRADGTVGDYITLPAAGGNCPLITPNSESQTLDMKGQDVYKFVANTIPSYVAENLLAHNGFLPKDIDYLVLHQANQRITAAVQERLGFAEHKIISNIEYLGNTSASSIPIALGEALQNGELKTPATVVVCGFGAGMCWGGGVIRLNKGIFKKENIFQTHHEDTK